MTEKNSKATPDLRKALGRIAIEQDRRLTRSAVSVASALISHANLGTGRCDPGLDRLVAKTDYSQQTISKALNLIVDMGWIERLRHGGRHHQNRYLLNWNALIAAGKNWEERAGLRQPTTASVRLQDDSKPQPTTRVPATHA